MNIGSSEKETRMNIGSDDKEWKEIQSVILENYRKAGNKKYADALATVWKCDKEDLFLMFDTGAFNDIAKSYLRMALHELTENGTLTEDQADKVDDCFIEMIGLAKAQEAYETY